MEFYKNNAKPSFGGEGAKRGGIGAKRGGITGFPYLQMESIIQIDFTAMWCGPCKMAAPMYEQSVPDILFLKAGSGVIPDAPTPIPATAPVTSAMDVDPPAAPAGDESGGRPRRPADLALVSQSMQVDGGSSGGGAGGAAAQSWKCDQCGTILKDVTAAQLYAFKARAEPASTGREEASEAKILKAVDRLARQTVAGLGGTAMKTCLAYIKNALEKPQQEEKFRSINLINNAYRNRVAPCIGGTALLKAVGFAKEEGRLHMSLEARDEDLLRTAKTTLEKALAGYVPAKAS